MNEMNCACEVTNTSFINKIHRPNSGWKFALLMLACDLVWTNNVTTFTGLFAGVRETCS